MTCPAACHIHLGGRCSCGAEARSADVARMRHELYLRARRSMLCGVCGVPIPLCPHAPLPPCGCDDSTALRAEVEQLRSMVRKAHAWFKADEPRDAMEARVWDAAAERLTK